MQAPPRAALRVDCWDAGPRTGAEAEVRPGESAAAAAICTGAAGDHHESPRALMGRCDGSGLENFSLPKGGEAARRTGAPQRAR